jgi:hypothetical protein
VSALDRWVNLEGEPPPGIRELLEAGREVPERTPDEVASMERTFLRALAAQRRRQAKARQAKWALAAGGLVAGVAAAVMLVIGASTLRGSLGGLAQGVAPIATEVVARAGPVTAVSAMGRAEPSTVPSGSASAGRPGSPR